MLDDALRISLPPGFSLDESKAFLRVFPVTSGGDGARGFDLAFALDGSWEPVGVHVAGDDGMLTIEVLSNPEHAASDQIRDNVARMLSLNVDGAGYEEIGARDPVIGRLQAEHPGFRPVLFPTAWEAAVWAVLSQRSRRTQALAIKRRLAEEYGHAVACPDGTTLYGFPGPAAVVDLPAVRGVSLQKLERLRSLAAAALREELSCADLASATQEDGMRLLEALPGIGPFSAELILSMGAGNTDIFPANESMLHDRMTALYGDASLERHLEIAEAWRPYRSWVSVLIRMAG